MKLLYYFLKYDYHSILKADPNLFPSPTSSRITTIMHTNNFKQTYNKDLLDHAFLSSVSIIKL